MVSLNCIWIRHTNTAPCIRFGHSNSHFGTICTIYFNHDSFLLFSLFLFIFCKHIYANYSRKINTFQQLFKENRRISNHFYNYNRVTECLFSFIFRFFYERLKYRFELKVPLFTKNNSKFCVYVYHCNVWIFQGEMRVFGFSIKKYMQRILWGKLYFHWKIRKKTWPKFDVNKFCLLQIFIRVFILHK